MADTVILFCPITAGKRRLAIFLTHEKSVTRAKNKSSPAEARSLLRTDSPGADEAVYGSCGQETPFGIFISLVII